MIIYLLFFAALDKRHIAEALTLESIQTIELDITEGPESEKLLLEYRYRLQNLDHFIVSCSPQNLIWFLKRVRIFI